jgi:hypothetical protein
MTTERATHPKNAKNSTNNNGTTLKPNKNTNTSSRMANKILTEADEQLNTYNHLHNYNNINRNIMSNFDNETEMSERINNLINVVDKAPKLNLEVSN